MSIQDFQILLIDDDEDDFINIRDLLSEVSDSKYRLIWKSSYTEGLDALRTGPFDACLLDYRLGAQTGIELLQEAQKIGIHCPTIVLTGAGDFDVDIKAMQIGAADYLVKGQLTTPLLERSIRYSVKHAMDMDELRDSKAQILQQDRLASLGLLASSLAHEIGTPMGIIRSRAELAQRRAEGNAVLKQDMQVVVSQIDRITKLVNSLLNLARTQHSGNISEVDISSVVEDVLNLVQHELDRKSIQLTTNLKKTNLVKAEAGPLGQVLLNLLVNSIHAIEDSKNKGHTQGHKIILQVEEKSESVHISVQDTGCGIPKENMTQLFKPFFTTKDIGQGSGLGLATSYKIITSWGGTIGAQSQLNAGTTFTVQLLKASKKLPK